MLMSLMRASYVAAYYALYSYNDALLLFSATDFGRGVYFARDSAYSAQTVYSPADSKGLRYMYYARVLVGEYTKGNTSFLVAPSKNANDPNEKYDSVVNDVKDPRIYVMFRDYEYYTEYLITFH